MGYCTGRSTSTGRSLTFWPRRSGTWRQTRRFFARALNAARRPTEVTTDRAPAYARVLDELVPESCHVVEQYANNPIEADHGRLKARTRPMRGLSGSAAPRCSVAGMRSFRTCATATTNSDLILSQAAGSRRSSASSPSQSETGPPWPQVCPTLANATAPPKPFIWTKTAEDILQSLSKYIAKISGAGH